MKVGETTASLDPERPAGAADQGRLAAAELAGDQDDVAGPQLGGEPRPERLGRRGPVAELRRSTEEVELVRRPRSGDGADRGRRLASAGGSVASSPGSLAKSSRSVSTSDGVRSAAAGWSSGITKTVRPPSVCTCGVPRTRVIPVWLPVSSLVAKLPSVAITRGSISSIWRSR